MVMKAKKHKKSKTQIMNNSCYVRNEGTFSTIKNEIASGNSKFHLYHSFLINLVNFLIGVIGCNTNQ